MKNRKSAYRFDNLAELRDAVNRMSDTVHAMAKHHPTEVLSANGPMLLHLIEETLSDGSKVYNFGVTVMTVMWSEQ